MCEANKGNLKFFIYLFLGLLLAYSTGVLQAEEVPTGRTQTSSQSSELLSRGSNNTLTAWEGLFSQGLQIYTQQSRSLERLTNRIKTLESGFGELTDLCALLSQSNADLKNYNEQIAERMQDKDEEIYGLYQTLDEQDKVIVKKDNIILKMRIIIGVLLLLILVMIIAVFRLL